MHRSSTVVVASLAALALAACSPDAVTTSLKAPSSSKFAVNAGKAGNYVVLLNGTSIPTGFAERVASLGGRIVYANGRAGFVTVSGLTADAATQIAGVRGVADIQADQAIVLDVPAAVAQADISAVGDPSVESQSNPAKAILASWQWNMRAIGANKAWAAGKLGSSTVTVAILDTGLDYDNRDLTGLVDLSRSASFMGEFVPATDTSTIRPADDTLAKNFFPARNAILDFNGHGTNVGAQVSSKAFAFAGVTSKTTLLGVKVLGSNGSGSLGSVLSGVLWAADHGADVANMSLGGAFAKSGNGRFLGIINKVFNYANRQGMLVVVAAGNASSDLQHNGNINADYCDAPHVVCVSAVGPETFTGNPDLPAFYTNYGHSVVTVAGPGGNAGFNADGTIKVSGGWPWSTAPGGADIASWVWAFCPRQTVTWNAAGIPAFTVCASGGRLNGFIGTSQASPHVAGLAALLVEKLGHGQPAVIKQAIIDSSDPINPLLGRGRINVAKALGI